MLIVYFLSFLIWKTKRIYTVVNKTSQRYSFMSNLDDMNLVETLTVVCFLQVIALTLFTPSSSKF